MDHLPNTIMVVDDEKDILDILECYLESKGFNVLTATSGNLAYELWLKHRPLVVVSDVQMNDGDGFSLIKKIKSIDSSVQIMLATGNIKINECDALNRGAKKLLRKPYTYEEVIEGISVCYSDRAS